MYIINYSPPFDRTFAYIRLRTDCSSSVSLHLSNDQSSLQQDLMDIPHDVKLQSGAHYWILLVSSKMFTTAEISHRISVEIQPKYHSCHGNIRTERGRFLEYDETYRSINSNTMIGRNFTESRKLFSINAPPTQELPVQISVNVLSMIGISLQYSWGDTINSVSQSFRGSTNLFLDLQGVNSVGSPIFSWLSVNAEIYDVHFSKEHYSEIINSSGIWRVVIACAAGIFCVIIASAVVRKYFTEKKPLLKLTEWRPRFRWKNCSICLIGFEKDDMCFKIRGCKHIYHKACLDPVLFHGGKGCPICLGTLDIAKQLYRCAASSRDNPQDTVVVSRPARTEIENTLQASDRRSIRRQSTLKLNLKHDDFVNMVNPGSDYSESKERSQADGDASSSTPSLTNLPPQRLRTAARKSIVLTGPGASNPFRTRQTSNSPENEVIMHWAKKHQNARRDPARTRSMSTGVDRSLVSFMSRSRSAEGVPQGFKRMISAVSSTPRKKETASSYYATGSAIPRNKAGFTLRLKSQSSAHNDGVDHHVLNHPRFSLRDPGERVRDSYLTTDSSVGGNSMVYSYSKRDSAVSTSHVARGSMRPVLRASIKRNPSRPESILDRHMTPRQQSILLPAVPSSLMQPETAFGSYRGIYGSDEESESTSGAEYVTNASKETCNNEDRSFSFNVSFVQPSTAESNMDLESLSSTEERMLQNLSTRRLSHVEYSRRKSQLINDAIFGSTFNKFE